MSEGGEITRLLIAADAGDPTAGAELYPLVEGDLHRIARSRKRAAGGMPGLDAPTTGLVNDVFCRLVGGDATTWRAGDRRKFFGYAARKIHDILIDLTRSARAAKRDVGRREELREDAAAVKPDDHLQLLVDLRAALAKLEAFDARAAALVRYRHVLGCTFEETAEVLDLSKTEAVRVHQRTMLWLKREMKGYDLDA